MWDCDGIVRSGSSCQLLQYICITFNTDHLFYIKYRTFELHLIQNICFAFDIVHMIYI